MAPSRHAKVKAERIVTKCGLSTHKVKISS